MHRPKGPAPNLLLETKVYSKRSGFTPNILLGTKVYSKRSGFTPNILLGTKVYSKRSGFTLVELLVAMSIFTAIAVVLYSCFRGGIVSYRRISEEADSQQRLRYVLLNMEKDLKNAFLMTNIPFEGEDKKVSFTSMLTDKENAPFNAGRISYYIKQGDNSYVLVRKTQSLQEALSLFAAGYDTGAELMPGLLSGKEEVVAEGLSGIRFTYLYAENQQSIPGLEGETEETSATYEWVDLWEEESLPVAVSVEVIFSDISGMKPQHIVKRVWIPAARPLRSNELGV